MGSLIKIFLIGLGLYYLFRIIGRSLFGTQVPSGDRFESGGQNRSEQFNRTKEDHSDEYVDYEEID